MTVPRRRALLFFAAMVVLQILVARSTRSYGDRTELFTKLDLSSGSQNVKKMPKTLLAFPYSKWYEQASPTARPLVVAGLLTLLGFLFSFIGISASDFFCPNLSTIASYLGLSESTAGVTFLAFGNGSPDVFSTFSALKGGTFGLAIGELIGAASFIISIVVGSIAFVGPFHVPRHAFLRDVLFFLTAVILLIVVLRDGQLKLYESGSMVLLYAAYVVFVVTGNWVNKRKRQKDTYSALGFAAAAGEGRDGQSTPLPNLHLPEERGSVQENDHHKAPAAHAESLHTSPTLLTPSSPARIRLGATRRLHSNLSHSALSPVPDDGSVDSPRVNFSLLGAVEFRDVVNSLRKESDSRGSTPSRSPLPPTIEEGGDYFGHAAASSQRRSSSIGVPGHHRKPSESSRQRAASHLGTSPSSHQMHSPNPPSIPPPRTNSNEISSAVQVDDDEPNPWIDQPGHESSRRAAESRDSGLARPNRPRVAIPSKPSIPAISVRSPSGHEIPRTTSSDTSRSRIAQEQPMTLKHNFFIALRVLFPSLQSFRHKSYLGMLLAVVSVPAILALTLTLPVVDDGATDEGGVALPISKGDPLNEDVETGPEPGDADGFEGNRLLTADIGEELHHLVDNRFSPLHSPLGRITHSSLRRIEGDHEAQRLGDELDEEDAKEFYEELYEEKALEFHKTLAAVQCIFGPALCTLVVFRTVSYFIWVMLAAVIVGCVSAVMVILYARDGTNTTFRLVRCFAGFICSMVWIAAIADEVVGVLRAVGEVLGLSDAIIGLTIFAVGNSLADLVANVTVAQFAPAMAYAACFGGPMLNLLLGVGGSGTYHMLAHPSKSPVMIHFSPTLWVSASGLVVVLIGTAIFVPMNGYLIDRRWAGCLIICYAILMMVNVAVEVKTGRS